MATNKKITDIDTTSSVPAGSKLYVNVGGAFRQATIDDVMKNSDVQAQINTLNNNLNLINNCEIRIGYVMVDDITGDSTTIELSESILNYRSVYICHSYYDNGVATFGHLWLPCDFARNIYSSDAGIAMSDNESGQHCRLIFKTDTTIEVNKGTMIDRYIVVYGVK